jgi:hypothetical protein
MKFMNYVDEGEKVSFYIFGDKVFEANEVGVVYDNHSGILLKHGPLEKVKAWKDRAIEKYCSSGYFVNIENLVMSSGVFNADQMNRMIDLDGYAKSFHERMESEKEDGHA